jgi:hypothetical protein
VSLGASAGHENVTNTYITDASFSTFPIDRNELPVYAEDRYEVAGRLFLSAGLRGEFFRTGAIPTDGFSRPSFPSNSIARVNPKLSAAYVAGKTRFHGSFGMGLRPPSGFDLTIRHSNPNVRAASTAASSRGSEICWCWTAHTSTITTTISSSPWAAR